MGGLIDLVQVGRSSRSTFMFTKCWFITAPPRVLEGLVSHHVAPVAGRVTDGKQDRFVLLPRQGERLRAPGVPVHRIVGVLLEVGTGFLGETVGHEGHFGAKRDFSIYPSKSFGFNPAVRAGEAKPIWGQATSNSARHQRRRLSGSGPKRLSSVGRTRLMVHPGNGGFLLEPQETPRWFGSKILMKVGRSKWSA